MSDDAVAGEEWVLPPERWCGTFLVYDFEGAHDRLPAILELIAAWLRGSSEYQLEQIAVTTDDLGWCTLSVTVRELLDGQPPRVSRLGSSGVVVPSRASHHWTGTIRSASCRVPRSS